MTALRHKALEVALTQVGVTEHGGNNAGPEVESYLKSVDRWKGVPWCAAFVCWCFEKAANYNFKWASAGVEVIYNNAKKNGWLVARPFKGDLVLFDFGSGIPGDHIGFVKKVLALGPVFTLRTVEGNTSSGEAGSQADGDGVFERTRVVKKSRVSFVRVPDDCYPPVKRRK